VADATGLLGSPNPFRVAEIPAVPSASDVAPRQVSVSSTAHATVAGERRRAVPARVAMGDAKIITSS